jgi:hypothetical protein
MNAEELRYLIHQPAFIIHHFRRSFYTQSVLFDSPPTLCYHHADSETGTHNHS